MKTYTHAIEDLDSGRIPAWANLPAPDLALQYWRLEPGSKMCDVLLAIRADEYAHKHVNSVLANLEPNAPNPFT